VGSPGSASSTGTEVSHTGQHRGVTQNGIPKRSCTDPTTTLGSSSSPCNTLHQHTAAGHLQHSKLCLTCVRGCGQRHGVPLGSTSQGSPGAPMGAQTEKKPKAKAAVCRCPSENIGFPALLGSAQTRQAVFAQQILFVIS